MAHRGVATTGSVPGRNDSVGRSGDLSTRPWVRLDDCRAASPGNPAGPQDHALQGGDGRAISSGAKPPFVVFDFFEQDSTASAILKPTTDRA